MVWVSFLGGRSFRGAGRCPFRRGFVPAWGVEKPSTNEEPRINERRAGGRSLRGGGGCPFRRGFVPAWGRNARLWEGCGGQRALSRNHGRERIDGAQTIPKRDAENADKRGRTRKFFSVFSASISARPRPSEFGLGDAKQSVSTRLRPSLRSQRKALGGCGCQRTLSRNRGRERMDGARVEGHFGVGEGVQRMENG